jgi:hypothetical protein
MILLTCKEVSLAFARGEFSTASSWTRFRLRMHLLICRQCRRFQKQLGLIEEALKTVVFAVPDPAATAALEQAIIRRLQSGL